MKKSLIFLIALHSILFSNAEGFPTRKSKQNSKNLKVYAKVLEHYGKSDFYLAQIDIVNLGDSTVSFWETTSCYDGIFAFSSAGILFINENDRLYFEKKIPEIPAIHQINKKVNILPHQKYTIKTQFYIKNRKRFLETNNDLRVIFLLNDANLEFMEDIKQIPSDTINYNW